VAFTRLIWSFQTHPGTAGFGGLDRNYDKAFQFGFYASIGLVKYPSCRDSGSPCWSQVVLASWLSEGYLLFWFSSRGAVSINGHSSLSPLCQYVGDYQSLHEERLEFFSPSDSL
jgi:hypothetical protein